MRTIDANTISEYKEVIQNEMVFVKKYVKDIPHQLIIAFYSDFEGLSDEEIKERQKAIYDMYALSLDDESLAIELALHEEAEIIFKPENYSVLPDGRVFLITRGGSVLLTHVKELGESREEIESVLSNWLYAVVRRTKTRSRMPFSASTVARIIDVEALTANYDYDTAHRLLDEYGLTPIEALLLTNGIFPTPETVRLFLPRFLPLFYYNGLPIHVIQMTNTDSGKSHFAIRLEFAFNFTTFSEMPSAAKLIYDARTQTKGAVFTSEGIVIDEIDKIKRERFDEVYQPLNSGLENGVWRRGVQTAKGVRLEGYRFIPFLLFGNIVQGEEPLFAFHENPRTTVNELLDQIAGYSTYSFVERFAIVDLVYQKIPITKYVIAKDGVAGCMRDSVYRALVKLIQNRIEIKSISPNVSIEGRLKRHADALFNVFKALLGKEFDEDLIAMIVKGEKTIDSLLRQEKVESETKETVIDMVGD